MASKCFQLALGDPFDMRMPLVAPNVMSCFISWCTFIYVYIFWISTRVLWLSTLFLHITNIIYPFLKLLCQGWSGPVETLLWTNKVEMMNIYKHEGGGIMQGINSIWFCTLKLYVVCHCYLTSYYKKNTYSLIMSYIVLSCLCRSARATLTLPRSGRQRTSAAES